MNYILKRAQRFSERWIIDGVQSHPKVIQAAKDELHEILSTDDKVSFLVHVLEDNEKEFNAHKLECTAKGPCGTDFEHESIAFYLRQELHKLGVSMNNDQFTTEEKDNFSQKLDQILNELQTLKDGQQIIYEDLREEMEEMKSLFFLGKKNWGQLFAGKVMEMVVGGVISETASKDLVQGMREAINTVLIK